MKFLIQKIAKGGNKRQAERLQSGLVGFNGLTDGWAHIGEAIESTILMDGGNLDSADIEELQQVLNVLWKAVNER